MPNGPSLDTVIRPAPEFVENEGHPPTYVEITYKDFLELQQSGKLSSKFQLDFDVNKELNMLQKPCPLLLLFHTTFYFGT